MNNLNAIGDGSKRKSSYDPDLARRFNEEVEAEERRKALEQKLRRNKPKPVETQEQPITQNSPIITLDDLEIEPTSPRHNNDPSKDKILYTFDKSLESLKQRGYERHLRPDEAFKIIIDALENPNSKYKQLSDDMLKSYREWFSLAAKRTSKTDLEFYLDPENLVWNGSKYTIQGSNIQCLSETKTFTINKGIPSQTYVDLNQFPNDIIEFLYSRKFNELPDIMKPGGDRKAQILLPQEGIIRPCGHGDSFDDFDVSAYYGSRASRGVRELAKNL